MGVYGSDISSLMGFKIGQADTDAILDTFQFTLSRYYQKENALANNEDYHIMPIISRV